MGMKLERCRAAEVEISGSEYEKTHRPLSINKEKIKQRFFQGASRKKDKLKKY